MLRHSWSAAVLPPLLRSSPHLPFPRITSSKNNGHPEARRISAVPKDLSQFPFRNAFCNAGNTKASIFPLQQRLPYLLQLLLLLLVHVRKRQVQTVQGLDNRGSNHQPCVPLVVRWNHVPRRPFGRRVLHHLFVRLLVVVPEFTLLNIVHRKLPILLRILQPFQKSLLLLL